MILSQTYTYAIQLGTFIAGCIIGLFPLVVCIRRKRALLGLVLMLITGALAIASTLVAALFSVIVGIVSMSMLH